MKSWWAKMRFFDDYFVKSLWQVKKNRKQFIWQPPSRSSDIRSMVSIVSGKRGQRGRQNSKEKDMICQKNGSPREVHQLIWIILTDPHYLQSLIPCLAGFSEASTRYQNQTQKVVIHPCPTYILDPLQYQCKGPVKSMENAPWRLEVQSKELVKPEGHKILSNEFVVVLFRFSQSVLGLSFSNSNLQVGLQLLLGFFVLF